MSGTRTSPSPAAPPRCGAPGTAAPRGAAGFTLISAVFLTVVLVVLGVSLVSMSVVQHTTGAQQVQAARANYAIRTGIEWAIRTANTGGCPAGPTNVAAGGQLASFTITVSCALTAHTVESGGGAQDYYRVDVTAQSGAYGSPDFVQRRGQAKVLGAGP